MKLFIGLILAILALVAYAERPSVPFSEMGWSTASIPNIITTVATKKDLLVYLDASDTSAPPPIAKRGSNLSGGPVMSVRRRNAEGVYALVGNFTEAVSPSALTNGKWVAMFGTGEGIGLFNVDENNNFSNLSTIVASLTSGFLLSDDTFVGYDSVSPLGDGNYTIRTYEYEASNNTWQEIPEAGLVVTYSVNSQPGITSYHVSDTHLVILDPTNSSSPVIVIYERQADKSWKFVESVPVNNTAALVNYNDVDTLTVWAEITDESGAFGVLFMYTKVNGKWTEQKLSTASVGFRPLGYFGLVTAFLNANNMLLGAPFEGFSGSGSPTSAGKVLLITRNDDGLWEPAADGSASGGLFGTGIGVNDYDVIIPSFTLGNSPALTYYTAPVCFYQPINVTCNNQQVNDCSQVNITSLYTVNNPQCGAVSATINGFSLVDNKALEAQFSFTKGFGADYSCNATVTCPVPPIVVQQTPSKVSSSVGVQFGLVSLFGFVSFLFM